MEGVPGAVMRKSFRSLPTQIVLWFHELSGSLSTLPLKVSPSIPQSFPLPNSKNYFWHTKIGFLSCHLLKTLNSSCFAPWITVTKNRLGTFGLKRNKQISLILVTSQSMRLVQLSKELVTRFGRVWKGPSVPMWWVLESESALKWIFPNFELKWAQKNPHWVVFVSLKVCIAELQFDKCVV